MNTAHVAFRIGSCCPFSPIKKPAKTVGFCLECNNIDGTLTGNCQENPRTIGISVAMQNGRCISIFTNRSMVCFNSCGHFHIRLRSSSGTPSLLLQEPTFRRELSGSNHNEPSVGGLKVLKNQLVHHVYIYMCVCTHLHIYT